jgi:hypothetical protein
MQPMYRSTFLLLPAALLSRLAAQVPHVPTPNGPPLDDDKDAKLPNGRLRSDELAKAAYADSLEDAKKMIATAEELKIELEKNDRYVVSLSAIKKTEEIEKLAKRIRGRLKQ